MKAMALRPADRYGTARALAEDIESWLADEPVSAWREPWLIRARRWGRRYRTPLTAVAAALLVTAALGVGVGTWVSRQRQARIRELERTLARIQTLHDRAAAAADLIAWREARAATEPVASTFGDLEDTAPGQRLIAMIDAIKTEASHAEEDRALLTELTDHRSTSEYRGGGTGATGYASIFRRRGLDPTVGQTDAIVARLKGRPGPVQSEVVAALDDWAVTLRWMKTDQASLGAVLGLARALDPDPQRDRLRADVSRPDLKASRESNLAMARLADLPAATALLLAHVLVLANETTAAMAMLQDAVMRHPENPWLAYELAGRLRQQTPPRTDEAIRYYSVARALRPELVFELGATLRANDRLREAVAVLRDLVRRRPDAARVRIELAIALNDQGEVAEAAKTMNEAVEIARRAVLLWPADALAHDNLGFALRQQGKSVEALAEFREVTRLQPDVGGHRWNLGQLLREMGMHSEALAEFRVEQTLEPDDPEVKAEVQKCERLVRLDHRLTSILDGTERLADAGERIDLAEICYHKSLYRASARFYSEAFAENPALAEDMPSEARYNAACSAALAAAGKGKDDPAPNDATRVVLRRQALGWLRSDLAAWVKIQKDGPPTKRGEVGPTLRHWKRDTDLAGLRDEAELAKLPEAERDACRNLWIEVDQRLNETPNSANLSQ